MKPRVKLCENKEDENSVSLYHFLLRTVLLTYILGVLGCSTPRVGMNPEKDINPQLFKWNCTDYYDGECYQWDVVLEESNDRK